MTTTWNPSDKSSNITLSPGDLVATSGNSSFAGVRSVHKVASGEKKYFEVVGTTVPGSFGFGVGMCDASFSFGSNYLGEAGTVSFGCYQDTRFYINDTAVVTGTYDDGDVVGIKVDRVANTAAVRLNGGAFSNDVDISSLGSGDLYVVFHSENSGAVATARFASGSWGAAAPSGFDEINSGTSVALTGQWLTSAVGSIAKAASIGLAGQAITAAHGALAPAATVAPSGQSATGATGALTVPGGTLLTGSQATGSAGSLTVGATAPLAGPSATMQRGVLSPGLSRSALGVSTTGAMGSLGATFAVSTAGTAAAAAQGALATGGSGGAFGAQLVGAAASGALSELGPRSQAWAVAAREAGVWSAQNGEMDAWGVQTALGEADAWTPQSSSPGSWH